MAEIASERWLRNFAMDPNDAELLADPYPAFAALREHDPVHWSDHGYWVVTRYDDVRAIVMDRQNFGQGDFERNIRLLYGEDFDVLSHPAYRWLADVFVFQDPPKHTRLRGLVTQALTARRVQAMGPRIQEITDRLLDKVIERGRMELSMISRTSFPRLSCATCWALMRMRRTTICSWRSTRRSRIVSSSLRCARYRRMS